MLFSHRHRAGIGPVATSSSPPRRSAALRLLAVAGCAILGNGAMALPRTSAAWGQTISAATVTEVLDSNQVFIQNQRAAVNSVAQRQQRVRTQAARTSLRFNNGAVARLAHNSSLMVGQCAQLNRGTLLVNGSLNGCSTTTVAGVRGTTYTLEVTESGETIVQVFEGEVIVGQRPDAATPEEDPLEDDPAPEEAATPANSKGMGVDWDGVIMKQASTGSDNNPTPGPAAPTGNPQRPGHGDGSPGIRIDLGNPSDDDADEPSETVDFDPDTVLVISEGQQVMINAESDEAVISRLTAQDFINLLEGPLIRGFSAEIPGIRDLRRTFQRLYPRVPLVPGLPSIIPLPPIRFPF